MAGDNHHNEHKMIFLKICLNGYMKWGRYNSDNIGENNKDTKAVISIVS